MTCLPNIHLNVIHRILGFLEVLLQNSVRILRLSYFPHVALQL